MPGKKGFGDSRKKSSDTPMYKMKGSPYKHMGSATHPTEAIAAHKGHKSMKKTFKDLRPLTKP